MELRNLHRRVHIGERGPFDPMVAISPLEDILNHVTEARLEKAVAGGSMTWWSGSRPGMAVVKTTAVHRTGARLQATLARFGGSPWRIGNFLAPEMMSPAGHNALYVFKLSES